MDRKPQKSRYPSFGTGNSKSRNTCLFNTIQTKKRPEVLRTPIYATQEASEMSRDRNHHQSHKFQSKSVVHGNEQRFLPSSQKMQGPARPNHQRGKQPDNQRQ